jgi:16S rRNA (adenine1518-N6/adenine1519-N6)-dimethyltransferase
MNSVKTKKSLGQHWLHDEASLRAMCELASVEPGDVIIEIGPGLGTLTQKLLHAGAKVEAVEFDIELSDSLKNRLVKTEELTVVNQDILSYDFSKLKPGYKVVANIPYYLTSNLIKVLSETSNPPKSATLLIQKEVAERLCAGPGDMSLLSVSAQMYFECRLGPIVPAALFTPPPKVDSQIVHLDRREQPLFGDADPRVLFRVVKAGFSNRRKTLHNSLSGGLHMSKDDSKKLLESAEISTQARPQELSLQEWINLSEKYATTLS